MVVLPKCVPLEETSGLLKQFGYHGQVNLGVRQVGMPQVNGEVVHEALHIRALLIPPDQSMDSETMTHVVQPRLVASTVRPPYPYAIPEPPECFVHRL